MTAIQTIQQLRHSYEAENSKLFLAEKTREVYEQAISTGMELYQASNDSKYLNEAFQLMEQNKAIVLLESIHANNAMSKSGIPDSLLQKEKKLRTDIVFFTNEINKEKGKIKNGNQDKIKHWSTQKFNLEQAHKNILNEFETNYPQYFQLRYESNIADVHTLQQKLPNKNTAILEFFVGIENSYVFCIGRDFFNVKKIKTNLSIPIQNIRKVIQQAPNSKNFNSSYQQFTTTAYSLYQDLLANSIASLPTFINQIIIIPDDQLGYLPFEILLTTAAPPSANYAVSNLDYLFEKYLISYQYSSSLLIQQSTIKNKRASKTFLGYAPSFGEAVAIDQRSCNMEKLYSLQCSPKEVESISSLFQTNGLFENNASKRSFENEASNYQILHLATHACVEETNTSLNKIFFTDDYLSNAELYNLDLNADLAVLSACNTGAGTLIKGEGIMSLARGFIHAGCPSILMSLWSVDDCATSDIMIAFYKELLAGKTKVAALQNAKINYLNTVPDKSLAHPYYWAAFTQFGNTDALDFSNNFSISKFLLIFGSIFFLGIIGKVIYNKKAPASARAIRERNN